MFRTLLWLALTLCLPGMAMADDAPVVDREAMIEAMGGAADEGGPLRVASSFAYEHYLAARLAEAAGDLPLALDRMKQAAAHDSASPEIGLALGMLYSRLGEKERAAAEMRRAMKALEKAPDSELLASIEAQLRSLGETHAGLPTRQRPIFEAVGTE